MSIHFECCWHTASQFSNQKILQLFEIANEMNSTIAKIKQIALALPEKNDKPLGFRLIPIYFYLQTTEIVIQ